MTAARPRLTLHAAARLDEFEAPQILGASRQLEIASELLVSLTEEHEGSSDALVCHLREVVTYLTALRGASSQAIPNALALMLDGLNDQQQRSPPLLKSWIIARVRAYDQDARRWMVAIAEYGAMLAGGSRRVLAYDYSSSVAAILRARAKGDDPPTVVLPEARTLDGGRRYVEELEETNLRCELIPDAAIGSKIRGCDLALIGAETISAAGGCYNTTGSLLVALSCHYWRVPLYVPSSLIKIDTRTLYGHRRHDPELGPERLSRLTQGWLAPLPRNLSVASPDLDFVPPELITGYITEEGILPPAAIQIHAARIARSRIDG